MRMSSIQRILLGMTTWRMGFSLFLAAPALWTWAGEPIDIGSRRELFVDRLLIETMRGASLRLQQPVVRETVLRVDRPWEGPFNAGQHLFQYDGKYHLYYRGMAAPQTGETPGTDRSVICLATSRDGVAWTKPDLGAAEWRGSRRNNLIADEQGRPIPPGFDVFLDARPGVPKGERIKAACYLAGGEILTPSVDPGGTKRLALYASADGVRFTRMKLQPDFTTSLPNAFDSLNVFFWSEAEQSYLCYFRIMDPYRSVARATSKDLIRWTEPVAMNYGGTPREHIYTNQTMPYQRAPHLYVALAARFMRGRRALSPEEAARLGFVSVGKNAYDGDCSDAVLMTARPGSSRFDRTFMESFVRPGGEKNNWGSRCNYPVRGIIETGPAEMSFFVNRHYAQKSWRLERCTLRLDGFAALHAPYEGGEMTTRPLRFAGTRLVVNYATSAAGGVRVEIQDAGGVPIPRFALSDARELIGDEIDGTVAWREGSDVSRLAGRPVRLRLVMKDADVFAFQFRDAKSTAGGDCQGAVAGGHQALAVKPQK
jgi:hypothetical protein